MVKKFWGASFVAIVFAACGGDSSSVVEDEFTDPIECDDCAQQDDVSSSSVSSEKKGLSSSDAVADSLKSSSSAGTVSDDSTEVSSSSKSDSSDVATSIGWSWNLSKDDLMNSKVSYGTMSDPRDHQKYKIVSIGSQIWMAENLNYNPKTYEMPSVCYAEKNENCLLAGRLYSWSAAIDTLSLAKNHSLTCGNMVQCELPGTVQGICPDGWHLPSEKEWLKLFDYVGGKDKAAKILKAKAGWNNNGNGVDSYGFSALPAGSAIASPFNGGKDMFDGDVGSLTYFWTSTPYSVEKDKAVYVQFISESDAAKVSWFSKIEKVSVRCVTDSASLPEESSSNATTIGWSWDVSRDSYLNPGISYDKMTDPRDGKEYKTVMIGKGDFAQTWMAQNLNYTDGSEWFKSNSWCYDDDPSHCDVAGRLYSWVVAVDTAALLNDPDRPLKCGSNMLCKVPADYKVQGICPDGWHIPQVFEVQHLYNNIGAGNAVMSAELKSTAGWNNYENGDDLYGLSIIPSGRKNGSSYQLVGMDGGFWLAQSYFQTSLPEYAYVFNISNSHGSGIDQKTMGYSVRCLKDAASDAPTLYWSWDIPKEKRMNPDYDYGKMIDSRDGQEYKTTVINGKTWMAENLNYADTTQNPELIGKIRCSDYKEEYCEISGRFYTWDIAVDICPEGWHLPDSTEWSSLIEFAGGEKSAALKSRTGWSWLEFYANGSDEYGFSALPVGFSSNMNGTYTRFWTSTEHSKTSGKSVPVDAQNVYVTWNDKTEKMPVRCVKN